MKTPRKQSVLLLLVPALALLVFMAMRQRPLLVETGQVSSGPLQETVEAEGKSRVHDSFTVAAPVTGRLMRIELHDGDNVKSGQAVAFMHAVPLDDRERGAAAARVSAAESFLLAAEEQVAHDRAECEQSRRELKRTEQMNLQGIATIQALELSRTAEQLAARTLAASEYRARAAAAQLKEARAALLAAEPEKITGGRVIAIRVPRSGPVLRVLEKSERVVTAGTPLLLIGDPGKLEIVVDLLSSDAVKIGPGAKVVIDEWGGAHSLNGVVRIVEPYAFTKVSALGIEEQRVNVVADFVEQPEQLGDGYRVLARIVTWSKNDVLKIPIGALFRHGEKWCVFVVEHGKAVRRTVTTGHRNQMEAEIISGLTRGESVVLHPSNQLDEGMRVRIA